MPLGEGSSPHGVIAGPDGAPWLTDGGQNALVRVDPKTREVRKWPLPQGREVSTPESGADKVVVYRWGLTPVVDK